MKKFGDIKIKKHNDVFVDQKPTKEFSDNKEIFYKPKKENIITKSSFVPIDLDAIHNSKKSMSIIAIIIGVSLFVFFVINYFGKIYINITPLEKEIIIDETVLFTQDEEKEGIHYEIMSVKDFVQYIPIEDNSPIVQDSVGDIRIFNTLSKKEIKLEKGYALNSAQNPEAKFYLVESITIPGYTQNSKGIIPGTIDTKVINKGAGDKNIKNPQDFTFNSKDNKLYARSIGEFVYNNKDKESNKKDIEQELRLKTDLFSLIQKELPKGYVSINNLSLFKNEITRLIPINTNTTANEVPQNKMLGNLSVVLIPEKDYNNYLIAKGEYGNIFKDGNTNILIKKKEINFTGNIDELILNKDVLVKIKGSFVAQKQLDIEQVCNGVRNMSFDNILGLQPLSDIFLNRVSEISIKKSPPWLISIPSQKRIHCILNTLK